VIENLTFGDVSSALTLLVAFIGSVAFLHKKMKVWLTEALEDQFNAIDKEMQSLQDRLDRVDLEGCKNFLVKVISDIDNGDQIGDTEQERFWEQYEYYKSLGGNTYISKKVEKLEQEGRL
jgi:hypothetical protein